MPSQKPIHLSLRCSGGHLQQPITDYWILRIVTTAESGETSALGEALVSE